MSFISQQNWGGKCILDLEKNAFEFVKNTFVLQGFSCFVLQHMAIGELLYKEIRIFVLTVKLPESIFEKVLSHCRREQKWRNKDDCKTKNVGLLYKTRSFEMTNFSLESIPVYKYIQGDPKLNHQNLSLSVSLSHSFSFSPAPHLRH